MVNNHIILHPESYLAGSSHTLLIQVSTKAIEFQPSTQYPADLDFVPTLGVGVLDPQVAYLGMALVWHVFGPFIQISRSWYLSRQHNSMSNIIFRYHVTYT